MSFKRYNSKVTSTRDEVKDKYHTTLSKGKDTYDDFRKMRAVDAFCETEVIYQTRKKLTRIRKGAVGIIPSRNMIFAHLLQTWKEIKKHKINFCLGCLSCFIVVLVVALMMSILANAPVVFLRLAELNSGEIDLTINAGSWTGYSLLNYTLVEDLVSKDKEHSYHSPRHYGDIAVLSSTDCSSDVDPYDSKWKYLPSEDGSRCNMSLTLGVCFAQMCTGGEAITGELILLDSIREDHAGVGRNWNYGKIDPGKCLLHSSYAKDIGVGKGDLIYIILELWSIFPGLYDEIMDSEYEYKNNTLNALQWSHVVFTVEVQGVYEDPKGKHSSSLTEVLLMEYDSFMLNITQQLHPYMPKDKLAMWQGVSLYEHAGDILFNLPPPRMETYLESDFDRIRKRVVSFASDILYKVGFNQVNSRLPVLSELENTRFFSLFLGLILNIVTVVLLALSILLIYSLLMVNVETRAFELGVLRMVGMARAGLVHLLLFQAFSYSIPSLILGILTSQVLMMVVSVVFLSMTGIPMNPVLRWDAVLTSSFLGLVIPVLASTLPIRNALGRNLHDSLDTKHAKVKAVQVTLERSEDSSFSWTVLVIGSSLAIFGFIVYYVFPLALLTFNFTLLLNIFFLLLLGMLLGLVLLSLNLEHVFERLIIALGLFWERPSIRAVVHKNLIAHRRRNRKTTIMYALSLGFIIFIIVSYQSTIASFLFQTLQENGAYLKVEDTKNEDSGGFLAGINAEVSAALQHVIDESKAGVGHTLISHSWTGLQYEADDGMPILKNIGRTYYDSQQLYSIAPNFNKVAFEQFLDEEISPGNPDGMYLSEQLYTQKGSSTALVGSRYITKLGLHHLHTHFVWRFEFDDPVNTTLIRMRPLSLLNLSPVFYFSKFPSETSQDTVVSFPTMCRLLFGTCDTINRLPMKDMLIELREDVTDSEIDQLSKEINAVIASRDWLHLWDYRDVVKPINQANTILLYFFSCITLVAMLIASFSLISSMYTNIHEQTKEIGILRAVGTQRFWMIRVYIYEAFTLVLASSILGVVIGAVVSYTLTLQRVLFTQLPIPFVFPWEITILVFIFSLVFALLSTCFPMIKLLRKPITGLMRTI